jgi:isopentenyl-diphosphate delta-isomerase
VNHLDARTGDGIHHRAFTTLVFNGDSNILLTRRAPIKRLWDTYWNGAVAFLSVEGQTQLEATRQRLREELGIPPEQYGDLQMTDKFEYKRYYINKCLE